MENMHQNASKCIILKGKFHFFSGEGGTAPQTPPSLGRGTPPPQTPPLPLFSSIRTPLLNVWLRACIGSFRLIKLMLI